MLEMKLELRLLGLGFVLKVLPPTLVSAAGNDDHVDDYADDDAFVVVLAVVVK